MQIKCPSGEIDRLEMDHVSLNHLNYFSLELSEALHKHCAKSDCHSSGHTDPAVLLPPGVSVTCPGMISVNAPPRSIFSSLG